MSPTNQHEPIEEVFAALQKQLLRGIIWIIATVVPTGFAILCFLYNISTKFAAHSENIDLRMMSVEKVIGNQSVDIELLKMNGATHEARISNIERVTYSQKDHAWVIPKPIGNLATQ